jgi:hypothetical protein
MLVEPPAPPVPQLMPQNSETSLSHVMSHPCWQQNGSAPQREATQGEQPFWSGPPVTQTSCEHLPH